MPLLYPSLISEIPRLNKTHLPQDTPTLPFEKSKWYSSVSYLTNSTAFCWHNILCFVVIYCNLQFFFSFIYTASRLRIFYNFFRHQKITQTGNTYIYSILYIYYSCLLLIKNFIKFLSPLWPSLHSYSNGYLY